MEAHSTRQRWTYAEFARLPTSGTTRYEVIAGELVVTPAPGLRHQQIATRLTALLYAYVSQHRLGQVIAGPFDVLFAEGDYLEPDLIFMAADRLHLLSDRGAEGAPDLVVEIISPSTAHRDRGVKLERYRHYGVAEYWVLDPAAHTIERWALTDGAAEPLVLGPQDTLRWRPRGAAAALDAPVAEVLADA